MRTFSKLTLTAIFALALTLIFFGCGGDGGGGSGDSSGSSDNGSEVKYGASVTYEGETYQTVVIGTQTWMARNLNYAIDGSECYRNDNSNCDTYGRLYNWATAMALPSSCNSTSCAGQISAKHQGICPSGWHIPTNADWDTLLRYVDSNNGTESPYSSGTAGEHLKAKTGWTNCISSCLKDTYGFAAMPGGYARDDGQFSGSGYDGYWQSATEDDKRTSGSYVREMQYNNKNVDVSSSPKDRLFSVRCVQD